MTIRAEDVTVSANSSGRKAAKPFFLVVFGGSGDLTHRKLIPAIFRLRCRGLLPEEMAVIAYARSENTDEAFRESQRSAVEKDCSGGAIDEDTWRQFASRLYYFRGSYDSPERMGGLDRRIEEIAGEMGGPDNRLYYLATPPGSFVPIVRALDEAGMAGKRKKGDGGWRRIVIEKPFGHDLASAQELNREVRAAFAEDQIYRIDHYLGKETVQNILVLRFANAIFEPIWNARYVDHVQITVSENLGLGGRGGYFDRAGILRDMVQNHIMHLLCLVAMEAPTSLDADAIRDEKVKLLRSLRPMQPTCAATGVVRAQYAAGRIDGEQVPGYRQEDGVAPDSNTETFLAMRVFVDNWRWSGVPFYIRTGKRLAAKRTEISVHFRPIPQVLFQLPPTGAQPPNVLTMRIQPDEGVAVQFQVKEPGAGLRIRPLKMDFRYAEGFRQSPPDAYERLLQDAALGEATLFTRSDEVEAAWRFVTPILEGCSRQKPEQMVEYAPGSWGPREADRLIAQWGARWHVR